MKPQFAPIDKKAKRLAHVRDQKEHADNLYKNGNFKSASAAYLVVLRNLQIVASSKETDLWLLTHLNLSQVALKMENWPMAAEHSRYAITLEPEQVKAWYRHAFAQLKLLNFEAASYAAAKACKLDPQIRDARILLNTIRKALVCEQESPKPKTLRTQHLTSILAVRRTFECAGIALPPPLPMQITWRFLCNPDALIIFCREDFLQHFMNLSDRLKSMDVMDMGRPASFAPTHVVSMQTGRSRQIPCTNHFQNVLSGARFELIPSQLQSPSMAVVDIPSVNKEMELQYLPNGVEICCDRESPVLYWQVSSMGSGFHRSSLTMCPFTTDKRCVLWRMQGDVLSFAAGFVAASPCASWVAIPLVHVRGSEFRTIARVLVFDTHTGQQVLKHEVEGRLQEVAALDELLVVLTLGSFPGSPSTITLFSCSSNMMKISFSKVSQVQVAEVTPGVWAASAGIIAMCPVSEADLKNLPPWAWEDVKLGSPSLEGVRLHSISKSSGFSSNPLGFLPGRFERVRLLDDSKLLVTVSEDILQIWSQDALFPGPPAGTKGPATPPCLFRIDFAPSEPDKFLGLIAWPASMRVSADDMLRSLFEAQPKQHEEKVTQDVLHVEPATLCDATVLRKQSDEVWATNLERLIQADRSQTTSTQSDTNGEQMNATPSKMQQEAINLLRIGSPPSAGDGLERFRDMLLHGPQLRQCRLALDDSGLDYVLPQGTLMVVTPDQHSDARRAITGLELHPFHLVVAEQFDYLIEEVLMSFSFKQRPRIKADSSGRQMLCTSAGYEWQSVGHEEEGEDIEAASASRQQAPNLPNTRQQLAEKQKTFLQGHFWVEKRMFLCSTPVLKDARTVAQSSTEIHVPSDQNSQSHYGSFRGLNPRRPELPGS